jgi:peptide/nickel transport system substrate-binding protein
MLVQRRARGSLYKSCEAKDESTAVINGITRYTSDFPTILLTLDSFSMQSPKASRGDANNVQKEGEGFKYPAYVMAPVGTGPYKLDKYDEANKTITLVATTMFWGEKAKTAKLVFKIIPDESTRRQELEAGSIDAYDLPNPVDWKGLEDEGNRWRGPPGVQHPLHGPTTRRRTRSSRTSRFARHSTRAQP